ncbi:hypothetical protein JTE90_017471, partial [Oedothorax gibbosus]
PSPPLRVAGHVPQVTRVLQAASGSSECVCLSSRIGECFTESCAFRMAEDHRIRYTRSILSQNHILVQLSVITGSQLRPKCNMLFIGSTVWSKHVTVEPPASWETPREGSTEGE